jgi:hemoglobin
MKNDIASRKDIEILVDLFYSKIKRDDQIGFIFSDIAKVNWEKHLPIMYDFFENMLFYNGCYTGNPMELHKHINRLFPLREEHFKQWNYLFSCSVDELFAGETAQLVKQRARSISTVMQIKIIDDSSCADKIF